MTEPSTPALSPRSFFTTGALVFLSSMVLSAGGFVFHAVATRRLSVDDYGALYAIISMSTLVVLPVTLFTPVVTKYAAEFQALHDDGHVRGLIESILYMATGLGGAYVAAAVVFRTTLSSFLHIPDFLMPLMGVLAALILLSTMFRAIGQGIQSFRDYALSLVTEGVVKVAGISVLAFTSLSVLTGSAAFLVGSGSGLLLMAVPILQRYARVARMPVVYNAKRILATTAAAASITLALAVVGSGDVLIVKHYFSATDAGLYSAVSISAKMLLYFVGFVPAVLIPQATYRHAKGQRTAATLWSAVGFVALVACAGVAAYRFLGAYILHALVGGKYDAGLSLLPGYASVMAILAMTNTLGSYAIATHRNKFVLPFIAATVSVFILIAVVHPTLAAVVNEMIVGTTVMLACLVVSLAVQASREAAA